MSGSCCYGEGQIVDKSEEADWLFYTLPLPHSVSIKAKNIIKPSDISIVMPAAAGDIERNAVEIFKEFFKEKTGIIPAGNKFQIIFGLLDKRNTVNGIKLKNADKLRDFPNNDQAYIIEADGENKLVVAALDPKGIYYGMHTLRQLLARNISMDSVTVPLAAIEDWPDFGNRGLWNGGAYKIYKELSFVKLNYSKNYPSQYPGKTPDGKPRLAEIETTRRCYQDARRYAFDDIPDIVHLNFWVHGFDKLYPGVAGKGEKRFQDPNNVSYQAPCASSPMLTKLLADTLKLFASTGIMEVSVWTTEYYSYCSCPDCLKGGQFVLEVKAIIAAWKEVKKDFPDFKVRVFGIPLPSEGREHVVTASLREAGAFEKQMPLIMAALPKEVILETVYNKYRLNEKGEIYCPLMDEYAAQGYKIVNFWPAALVGYTGTTEINHLIDGLNSLYASKDVMFKHKWYGIVNWLYFTQPDMALEFASHRIDAVAEWSWNSQGRSYKDYFKAWATVTGYNRPDLVAAWAELAGKWDWKLYGFFEIPTANKSWIGAFMKEIKAGNKKPLYFPGDIGRIESDLIKMKEFSAEFNKPQFRLQTEHMLALCDEVKIINELIECYNNKTSFEQTRNVVVSLEKAINRRSETFANLKKLINDPEVFRGMIIDFPGQIDLLKNELLPLAETSK